ncbi:MAG TPA: hypothetical protein VG889_01040 [Rhizomicrobium sp.]|nr:hypothetical protein [Rhizomicrobium sp.]
MILVSPHYDDVILSLPGRLAALGARATVVVPFSDEDAEMESTCLAIYRRLNVTVHPLDMPEAARRNVPMRPLLMPARGEFEGADRGLIESLAAKLAAVLTGASGLIAPAMRVHIDHAITVDALAALAPSSAALYLDQPYAARWPRLAARAVAGRTAVPLKSDSEGAEGLIAALGSVVQKRHVQAILAYRRERGAVAEAVWFKPDASGPVGEAGASRFSA